MEETIQVSQCGDRELWVMSGTYPDNGVERWTIPFFADPFAPAGQTAPTHYRLDTAFYLTSSMLEMVGSVLANYRQSASRNIIVKAEDWVKLAAKAPGITPDYYLRWKGHEKETIHQVEREFVSADSDLSADAAAFCAQVTSATQVVPHGTMKLVFRAIMNEGLAWLAEKRKPLDLGFIKLVPVPYRQNWKSIMKSMYPACMTYFRKANRVEREAGLLHMGFLPNLFNTKLTSIDPTIGNIHWSIDIIHGKEWWGAVESVEQAKLKMIGPVRYANYVRQCIKKAIPAILEIFGAWGRRMALPCAGLDNGKLFGREVLRAYIPKGKVRPQPPEIVVESIVDIGEDVLRGTPYQRGFQPASEILQAVPDIQSVHEDVWNGQPKLAERADVGE